MSARRRSATPLRLEIGELLMKSLKKLDKVAYVRFASVYLNFKDVKEFMDELKGAVKGRHKEIILILTPARRLLQIS